MTTMVFGLLNTAAQTLIAKPLDVVVFTPAKALVWGAIDVIGKTKNGVINVIWDTYTWVKTKWNEFLNFSTDQIGKGIKKTLDAWNHVVKQWRNKWWEAINWTRNKTWDLTNWAYGAIKDTSKYTRNKSWQALSRAWKNWAALWRKWMSLAWQAWQKIASAKPVMARAESLRPGPVVKDMFGDAWRLIENTTNKIFDVFKAPYKPSVA